MNRACKAANLLSIAIWPPAHGSGRKATKGSGLAGLCPGDGLPGKLRLLCPRQKGDLVQPATLRRGFPQIFHQARIFALYRDLIRMRYLPHVGPPNRNDGAISWLQRAAMGSRFRKSCSAFRAALLGLLKGAELIAFSQTRIFGLYGDLACGQPSGRLWSSSQKFGGFTCGFSR